MFKAIGFDYGGVLNHSKSALPGIAKLIDVPEDVLRHEYYKNNTLANIGSMSYEDLWHKILTDLGHGDKGDLAVDHMRRMWDFTINNRMLDLIDELRDNGFKTGLLSNNTIENGQKMRERGLEKHFDCFLISAEIGYQKPEPESFAILCESLKTIPQELIFIDDSPSSLRKAKDIGYEPILFLGYEKLREDLIKLGVLDA